MSSIEQNLAYVSGFESLYTEVTDQPLEISGTMPPWLSGVLLRNGPGAYDSRTHTAEGAPPVLSHWFDGLSMLHRFEVSDGEVRYSNRLLDSDNKRSVIDGDGTVAYREFATDPCQSLFRKLFAFTGPKTAPVPNASVNIAVIDGRMAALTETPMPVEFDPSTLQTVGVIRPDDELDGNVTTAHPHVRTGSGELVNSLLKFSRVSTYDIYRLPPHSTTRVLAGTITTDMPSYMHSFAITENYAILVEFPLVVNPLDTLLHRRTFIENYRWKPERGTAIRILHLDTGEQRDLTLDTALFSFHHVNAFEDGSVLHLDLCGYDDAEVIETLYLSRLKAGGPLPPPTLRRIDVDLDGGRVTHQQIGDATIELPRIDSDRAQLPYRYAYGVSYLDSDGSDFLDAIVKMDVTTGSAVHWHRPNCYPGEPVFVARPDRAAGPTGEDDGVLLTVVLDGSTGRSFLCVLDARDLSEIARAEAPHAIPFGFHGGFVRGTSAPQA